MLTWLEIDPEAIRHNTKQFKKLIGPKVLLMPVIKANAYGHGFIKVAQILQNAKEVDRICVVNLDESITLIERGLTKKPIMILSFFDQYEVKKIEQAVKNNIIFPLYNLEQAEALNRVGKRQRKKIKVHLKIDTGTSRLGILPDTIVAFVKSLKAYTYLEIEGLWSHFASSETDSTFTKKQYQALQAAEKKLAKEGLSTPIVHIACTASTLLYKNTHNSAVRVGLGLYGLYPNKKRPLSLIPALSWQTTVIQVKTIPRGSTIGYGRTYKATRPMEIAVLPVGYADGYDRRLSNNGKVLIKHNYCKIVGRICMNICMVDVTGLEVSVGDVATLIGQQGFKTITVDDMANWCKTINYEIVSRINPLLPRL